MKENEYQSNLKKRILRRFPDSKIIRLNPNDNWQGIPDLLVLNNDKWAALEVKKDKKTFMSESGKRPNQNYYINQMKEMSYASFIYPENEEEVLNELSGYFGEED